MGLSYPLSEVPSWETPWTLGSVLSMSAEQIVSKWSFRLVGNTPFGPSPDGGPETGGGTHEIHLRVLPVGVSHVHH